MTNFKFLGTTAFTILFCAGSALADDSGKREYMNSCATCHGETAKGGGPMTELLKVNVPSLTGLSAANDGVFPMLEVIHTIDGRQGTRGHGFPMPIWGTRFSAQAESDGPGLFGGESIVRGRILSIAYYLESIQD